MCDMISVASALPGLSSCVATHTLGVRWTVSRSDERFHSNFSNALSGRVRVWLWEFKAWHFGAFTPFLFLSAQLKRMVQLLRTKRRVHKKQRYIKKIHRVNTQQKWSHSFDCATLCAPVSTFKTTFNAKTKPVNMHGSPVRGHDHMIQVTVVVCGKSYTKLLLCVTCKMTFKGCSWYRPLLAPFPIVLPDFSQQRNTIKLPSRIHNPIISQQVTTNKRCIQICFRVNTSYAAVLRLQSSMLWEHL